LTTENSFTTAIILWLRYCYNYCNSAVDYRVPSLWKTVWNHNIRMPQLHGIHEGYSYS